MTIEDEAKILQDSAEGWKRANISRVLSEMSRHGITLDELTAYWHNGAMVCTTQTPILPAVGYKVAGE